MAKWVTFYYDVIRNEISNLETHENKKEAEEYFNNNCYNYFSNNLKNKKYYKLPASYGYPMRKFVGMTKKSFEENFKI